MKGGTLNTVVPNSREGHLHTRGVSAGCIQPSSSRVALSWSLFCITQILIRSVDLVTKKEMPTFLLYIKADLENISKIEVPEGGRFCIDVSSIATALRSQPADQQH